MAKTAKLTKLKSAIKRLPSFPKLGRTTSSIAAAESDDNNPQQDQQLHAVYVGKSRRRYLVGSEVLEHPLFQELVDRSTSEVVSGRGGVVVACEVVLFEHLLWMLENDGVQMGAMDELVEFYTC